MIEGDSCNFCGALLDAHCDAGARQNDPRFCELKEEYWTTDMSSDAMLDRLFALATPEQLQAVDPEVTRRMRAHRYGPTATSAATPPAQGPADPAAQAAARWLDGYRNGKGASA